jgi:predicted DCC family thiol-disulfide oxidoreductase YuxK
LFTRVISSERGGGIYKNQFVSKPLIGDEWPVRSTSTPNAGVTETIFYDGHCGLCHRTVRFVLAMDRSGTAFRFAPLHGEAFNAAVPPEQRAALPDSIVVRTVDGALLIKARGVLHILKRLGGLWRAAATVARVIPASWLDTAYDCVARVRHKLFARPAEACPLVGAELRKRFDP